MKNHKCNGNVRSRQNRFRCIRRAYEIQKSPFGKKDHNDSLFKKKVNAIQTFLARFAI